MAGQPVEVSFVVCGGATVHGSVPIKIVRETHVMTQLFWLSVRGGSLQLPSFSPWVKYTGTLEMDPGVFQVYLISIAGAVFPPAVPVSAISSAIRYLHWTPKPTFWAEKRAKRRKRRRGGEEEGEDEEEEADEAAEASIAIAQSDVVLNRFEDAADDPASASSRPGRMVAVMGKPYIDKSVRLELGDIGDLVQQVKDQIAAQTGRDRGPYSVKSAEDVGILTGHPTLSFKCKVLFSGLFSPLPPTVLLALRYPQSIAPHQLAKVQAAWDADPGMRSLVRFCGKYVEAGVRFSADEDLSQAAHAVQAVYEFRRCRNKQSFFCESMHDSLCNMSSLIQMEEAQGFPGVLLPQCRSDSGSHVHELEQLLSVPQQDEGAACGWWASDVAAFAQIRQQFCSSLRAISIPVGFEEAMVEADTAQQRSGRALYVCESVRHMRRVQEMAVMCCQGLSEPDAVDEIKRDRNVYSALQRVTHVYILDAHAIGISKGLKILRAVQSVCADASVTVCFDPFLLAQEHRAVRLAHAVVGSEDITSLQLPESARVLEAPQSRQALSDAIMQLTDADAAEGPATIAFAAVAKQIHARLALQCPALLVVPRPGECSYWTRAFQGHLPLNLVSSGRVVWSPAKHAFGCVVSLSNIHGLNTTSLDRWRIPGSLPVRANISFQGTAGASGHSFETETLTKAHVAVNELSHALNPHVVGAPCLFLLRSPSNGCADYPMAFLYRVYCALRAGAITEVVWVEPSGSCPT